MINQKLRMAGFALLASLSVGIAFADATPPSLDQCQAAIQANPSNSPATAALLDQCMQYNVCSQLNDAIANCNSVLATKDFMANYLSNPVLQSSSSSFHASHSNNPPATASNSPSAQTVVPDPYSDNNVVILKPKKQTNNSNNIHWF